MGPVRKRFEGVSNIIRFNWHFYLLAGILILLLFLFGKFLAGPFDIFTYALCLLITASVAISILVSLYVYDLSGLYRLDWLNDIITDPALRIININAGFDETSAILRKKYSLTALTTFDFYDPVKHTEVSIRRARKAYPLFENTKSVNTSALPLPAEYADMILIAFSAHEIRNDQERVAFFKEVRRVLADQGTIVVVEHLRDVWNFLAYNFGFFHFFSRRKWNHSFKHGSLKVVAEHKKTPFVTIFILKKNAITS
jgi:SAM-dependent methyltransferase